MISKAQISFIKSLHLKKNRKDKGLFLVEGIKSTMEFLQSGYQIDSIYHTADLSPKLVNLSHKININEISATELSRISTLTTPHGLLAVLRIPETSSLTTESLKGSYTLILDDIQDPGNLGTIIRTADWFDIKHIICSPGTVEAYNPKVVQASMGSLARITIHYLELDQFFRESDLPVYGALLDGKSIYQSNFKGEGLILLGNEGKGISPDLEHFIQFPITIPRFGKAESLNVAISASIICSELRRNS